MAVVYFRCLHCKAQSPAETDTGVFVCPFCATRFDIKKTIVPPKNTKARKAYLKNLPKIPFPMGGEKISTEYYSAPAYGKDCNTAPRFARTPY